MSSVSNPYILQTNNMFAPAFLYNLSADLKNSFRSLVFASGGSRLRITIKLQRAFFDFSGFLLYRYGAYHVRWNSGSTMVGDTYKFADQSLTKIYDHPNYGVTQYVAEEGAELIIDINASNTTITIFGVFRDANSMDLTSDLDITTGTY